MALMKLSSIPFVAFPHSGLQQIGHSAMLFISFSKASSNTSFTAQMVTYSPSSPAYLLTLMPFCPDKRSKTSPKFEHWTAKRNFQHHLTFPSSKYTYLPNNRSLLSNDSRIHQKVLNICLKLTCL